MFNKKTIFLGFASVLLAGTVVAAPVHNTNITEEEVRKAQEAWGAALIQISQDYSEGGLAKAKETAEAVLNQAYGYAQGPVLFKPTLATGETTFRITQEGALAYFVGDNPEFGDSGFALKGWREYSFENAAVYINGDLALTMGHVHLINAAGEKTTVDKTWGFKKDDQGDLRIVLHHSSLPYSK
ncbi:phosphoribosyl-AMP cyclohydrolase [Nitrincola tapanii]|uniref:Phosphoribosyl-AMP cyclohydrolase n=1 Tax=Nitrincola tapanii TaxID=1708751 RepID=A0A5A9W510_9GAMM|nr:phosphoribosyl-AMP cyclohydrolase [Nitrincola tapanii]KAA0875870.1 phosphoribosyl-AMP cyclohydrolase [Nitrincola tapanii]